MSSAMPALETINATVRLIPAETTEFCGTQRHLNARVPAYGFASVVFSPEDRPAVEIDSGICRDCAAELIGNITPSRALDTLSALSAIS